MKKYKVCIYGIAKNEEKFINRFMDSVQDADLVVVGDTGSTDRTVELLRARGAVVHDVHVSPFRFDFARNAVLEKIPDDVDICISVDMDEVLSPGWREALEAAWEPDVTQGLFTYNWSFLPDGSPAIQYWYQKIHARHAYRWIYPAHEILDYIGEGPQKVIKIPGFVLNHYPDPQKSRSFYLDLLQLAVNESPTPRNLHYLGREFMYAKRFSESIATLQRYLDHPAAVWDEERSASMRFIGRGYQAQKNTAQAIFWFKKAAEETPWLREPYLELALLYYNWQRFAPALFYCEKALEISCKSMEYINELNAWDSTPYDIAAICCYHLKLKEKAISYSEKAIAKAPWDKRLLENHQFYLEQQNQ